MHIYIYIYELQPKFRLMESSIRDIYFLEIELGLGIPKTTMQSSKNDNICLYTKT